MGDQQPAAKRVRGKAKLNFLKNREPNQKFEVDVTFTLPHGTNVSKLSRFIGKLARDGKKFPIREALWENMNEDSIKSAVHEVKQMFELSEELDRYVIGKLNELWRSHKAALKSKGFTPYADDEEEMYKHRAEGVDESDWDVLVEHWSSEDVKKVAATNALNRSKKKLNHRGGSKPFIEYSMELKKKLNKRPSRKELFIETYRDKNNPNEGPVAETIRDMEELQEKVSQGILPSEGFEEHGPNDIVCKVLGKRGGRVLWYGPHAKPKKFWQGESSTSSTKEKEKAAEEKVDRLENLLHLAMAKINTLEAAAARNRVPVNNNNTVSDDEVAEETPSPAAPI